MLASSGLNFGFRRTLPHMLGVNIGFSLMILLVGAGLGAVFHSMPLLYTLLKYGGAAYLLYLAWKIATAGEIREDGRRARPFTFLQACRLPVDQSWAWVMVVGVAATYIPESGFFA